MKNKLYIIVSLSFIFIAFFSYNTTKAEIIGTSTSIIWQENATSTEDWTSSVNYCDNLELGGYNNWRLPTVAELLGGMANQLLGEEITNNFLNEGYYWSINEDMDYPGMSFIANVSFGDGVQIFSYSEDINNENIVRCVSDIITQYNCEGSIDQSFINGFSYGEVLIILFLLMIFTLLFFDTLKRWIFKNKINNYIYK